MLTGGLAAEFAVTEHVALGVEVIHTAVLRGEGVDSTLFNGGVRVSPTPDLDLYASIGRATEPDAAGGPSFLLNVGFAIRF